jgi:hypothetical protein
VRGVIKLRIEGAKHTCQSRIKLRLTETAWLKSPKAACNIKSELSSSRNTILAPGEKENGRFSSFFDSSLFSDFSESNFLSYGNIVALS